jgi:hypothetical protein
MFADTICSQFPHGAPRSYPPAAIAQPTRSAVLLHHVPATADTVHWGYFSKKLKPVIEVSSGDYVTLETPQAKPARPQASDECTPVGGQLLSFLYAQYSKG